MQGGKSSVLVQRRFSLRRFCDRYMFMLSRQFSNSWETRRNVWTRDIKLKIAGICLKPLEQDEISQRERRSHWEKRTAQDRVVRKSYI